MKSRYIVIYADGRPVFNSRTQGNFFMSAKDAHRGIREFLDEEVANDEEYVYTVRESGLDENDFLLFVEVSP